MNNIASDLQKAIQSNFARLDNLNMGNNAQVLCSCSLIGAPVPASPTKAKPVAPMVTITPDFVPGQQDNGRLNAVDVGNTPFILPEGVTQDTILQEQAAAWTEEEKTVITVSAPVVPEVATTAASPEMGATVPAMAVPPAMGATPPIITTEASGETTVAVTTPGANPTTTTVSTTNPSTITVEKFAPISSFDTRLTSYRDIQSSSADYRCPWEDKMPENPNLVNGSNFAPYYGTTAQYGEVVGSNGYARPFTEGDRYMQVAQGVGNQECRSVLFSSWFIYILCMGALLYFVTTQFNLI
jgi:hypothetical protein